MALPRALKNRIDLLRGPLLPCLLLLPLLQLLGGDEVWRFAREAVLVGEWWRWVSGHFVHLDGLHLGMNLAALALLQALLGAELSPRQWFVVGGVSLLAIDLGLWWQQLDWYAGLSGIVHGWWLAGALLLCLRRQGLGGLLSAALLVKLAVEQLGYGSDQFSGMPVLVDAHLWGALGGLAILWPASKARQQEQHQQPVD